MKQSMVGRPLLFALAGIVVLILLGGGQHVVALGFALILPGLALLIAPPRSSLGRLTDLGLLGVLASFAFSFLPVFYWKTPAWRKEAVETFSIELPSVLSAQPWLSFEAFLLALAGVSWLYFLAGRKVNRTGRKWVFSGISIVMLVIGGVAVYGNLNGWRYPGAEDSTAFSFFPNRNQMANFLALGGVVSFGHAMEGLHRRRFIYLLGFAASGLCLFALILGVARAGVLLYFIGLFVWFILRLRRSAVGMFFKLGIPLLLITFSVFLLSNERTFERVADFVSDPAGWTREYRVEIYRDSAGMLADSPMGVGYGNFSTVFPQYREHSKSFQTAKHPESDVVWLATEGGVLALVALGFCVVGFGLRCRNCGDGASGSSRIIALTAVILFFLHSLVDVSGHRPGTMYFALLFVALALPRAEQLRPVLPTKLWRCIGLLLLGFGMAWSLGGLLGWPMHSTLIENSRQTEAAESIEAIDYASALRAQDAMVSADPLNWQHYFRRAQIILSDTANYKEAAADFRRARFVEPNLGSVSFEEGVAWIPYDIKRTISAWRETLFRENEYQDDLFRRMMRLGWQYPQLMDRIINLSWLETNYRADVLFYLKGEALMKELEKELAMDPGLAQFDRAQRTQILANWIRRGDLDTAESFLLAHSDSLDRSWALWFALKKNQANFEDALVYARENLQAPEVPAFKYIKTELTRLEREFQINRTDVLRGAKLLRVYLDRESWEEALDVINHILDVRNPPDFALYWKGEILFQLNEYSESWYAFEAYIKGLD